jgi:hypothetical protein
VKNDSQKYGINLSFESGCIGSHPFPLDIKKKQTITKTTMSSASTYRPGTFTEMAFVI